VQRERRCVGGLFVALASIGCARSARPEPATRAALSADEALTVATFNVNFAIAEDAATIAAVQRIDVDVLLLQETNARWERSLAPWIAERRLHARFWRSERLPAGGAGVVSRWPISDERSVDSAVGWFQAHRFNVRAPRGALAWLNRERALCSALPGFEPDATTWRWTVGPIELTERLDHIVYSPRELEAVDARVLRVGQSDHLPVRAVFRWRR
jgi:endonuclease/exonuclease/phosphatase (EEP) superfamily protein YafD